MAELVPQEPQSAADYQDRVTEAVKMVLVEIGQILGSFRGKFAVVGGSVPWLLLEDSEMEPVGTLDVDLNLDAEALQNGCWMSCLQINGGSEGCWKRLSRAPSRSCCADLATKFHQFVAVEAEMPDGGTNRVEIAVCSIPVLLAMKGYALNNRMKRKDAYDVYFCIRNYPDGPEALAEACRALLEQANAKEGYGYILAKFGSIDGYGPDSVRKFVEETRVLGERTADQWQQDAYAQVNLWLKALALTGSALQSTP